MFGDPINSVDVTGLATVVGKANNPYTQKLKTALAKVRKELQNNPSPKCDACFQAQPNPAFKDWRTALLTDGGPPYIHAADKPSGVSTGTAAYSQKGAPFDRMFIFKDFIDKSPINAKIPSVTVHELGHLARQDTKDNDPSQFFNDCICGSLTPGAYQ